MLRRNLAHHKCLWKKLFARSYWIDNKTIKNTNVSVNLHLISKLEETHESIDKILKSEHSVTYLDKKELIKQSKILGEHIGSIKKIAGIDYLI